MEAFNLLRRASWGKRHVKFDDLPLGDYPVTHFAIADAQYGPTLKAEIGDRYVFLPKRFVENQTEESVRELNTGRWMMQYRGKDASKRNL